MDAATIANRTLTLTSGSEIAYRIRENATHSGAPAVVLLHGFCGSSAYWADILPLLPESGALIVPDLRGHGSSSAPEDEVYTMESFADDIEDLLKSLQAGKIVLFGHSLGGYIAAAFAERYPDRLQALSLVHSTALPDTDAAKENRDKAAAAIRRDGIASFVGDLVPKLFAPEHLDVMPGRVQAAKAAGSKTSPHGAAATALGMKVRENRSGVLQSLAVPVLLVAGAKDGVIPQERTFSFEAAHASRAVLDRSGHMGMLEQPRELAAVMEDFIRTTAGI